MESTVRSLVLIPRSHLSLQSFCWSHHDPLQASTALASEDRPKDLSARHRECTSLSLCTVRLGSRALACSDPLKGQAPKYPTTTCTESAMYISNNVDISEVRVGTN